MDPSSAQAPLPVVVSRPGRPLMPLPVRAAIALIGLQVLVALFDMRQVWSAAEAAGTPNVARYALLAGAVGVQALIVGLIAALVWRKNWARIGWALLTLMALAMLFVPQPNERPASQVMLGNVLLVASVLASYLLFSAGARPWFRRAEPEHE